MRERKLSRSKNSIPDMFVLIVFAVFAVAVITVLSLGISSYQKLVAENDISYQERTCVQYIYSKLQHAGDTDRLYTENYAGGMALVIEEDFEGEVYYTKIYAYDGWLCESFSADQDEIVPETGEKIVRAKSIDIACTDTLVAVDIETEEGKFLEISYSVRGGKEQAI